jgi:AcrR family transcriptional regulator
MNKVKRAERKTFKAGEELRIRILEAASQLFGKEGYENVSIKRIAEEAGCSQMAMYRHFPDKSSLIRHLCTELYRQFTIHLHEKYDSLPDPKERLLRALRDFILISHKNPHHYRLTFVMPTHDFCMGAVREGGTNPAFSYFRQTLKLALPAGTSAELVEERLHQILALLHGMTVMLITRPRSYGLTKENALRQFELAFDILLNVTPT